MGMLSSLVGRAKFLFREGAPFCPLVAALSCAALHKLKKLNCAFCAALLPVEKIVAFCCDALLIYYYFCLPLVG